MRLVVQRVSRASVTVDRVVTGSIGTGLLILVGIEPGDGIDEIEAVAEKVANLRVFPDDAGLMNRSIIDTGGSALVVSQFTLLADVRKGRRPSFSGAAPPETAEPLVGRFADSLRERGVATETGLFGARMAVELVNDGPVTVIIEAREGRIT